MKEPGSFRMHPRQKSFFEGGPREILLNQRSGRRYATELWIKARAMNPEQAALAIADLDSQGIAMLDGDGNRVKPGGRRRFTIVRFDEEKRR